MRYLYALAILLLIHPAISFSQNVTLKGKVSSGDGAPLTGVSVMIKGKSTGTTTDDKAGFLLPLQKSLLP